jgi:hypothetical protein
MRIQVEYNNGKDKLSIGNFEKKKIVTTRENKSCVDGLLNKVYNLKCVYLI